MSRTRVLSDPAAPTTVGGGEVGVPGPTRPVVAAHVVRDDDEAIAIATDLAAGFAASASERDRPDHPEPSRDHRRHPLRWNRRAADRKYKSSGAILPHLVPIVALDDQYRAWYAIGDRNAPGLTVVGVQDPDIEDRHRGNQQAVRARWHHLDRQPPWSRPPLAQRAHPYAARSGALEIQYSWQLLPERNQPAAARVELSTPS